MSHRHLVRCVCVLSLALLLGCSGTRSSHVRDRSSDMLPVVEPSRAEVSLPARRFQLANGLVVLIRERHEVPLVASVILYKVGSRDEPAGETGLSHFMEHMMFKGTETRKKGDIDHLTQVNGGENNAFTTKDVTAYHFVFPSQTWKTALDIEADRMRNCVFDPAEVESERNVVKEEMRGDLDTPWEELTNRLDEAVFGARGYAHPTIGYEKDLDRITRDRFFAHYRKFYAPNNAVLVLEGDLDTDDAIQAVRSRFEAIPSTPIAERPLDASLPADGQKRLEVEDDTRLRRSMVGFRTCRYASPDSFVMHVIAAILAEGETSRMKRALSRQDPLLREIDVSQDDAIADSVLYVQAELYEGREPKDAEKAIFDAFARLRSEPVSAEELERAKNQLETDFAVDNESCVDHATLLATMEALAGSADAAEAYPKGIRAVTADDVLRVAKKYLTPENSVVAWTVASKGEGGEKKPETKKPPRRSARDASEAAGVVRLAPVERWVLPNGLAVLFQRTSSIPAVTLSAHVRADRRAEPEEKAGLAHLLGGALTAGTTSRNEEQVLEAIEGIGGRLSCQDQDVTVTVLTRQLERGAAVVADLLRNPSFPNEGVERARKKVIGEIAFAEEDPDAMALDAFREAAYEDHPFHRAARGTRETVQAITREDLVAHHKRWFLPNNTILVVCGDAASEEVHRVVEAQFGGWEAGKVPSLEARPVALPKEAREVSLDVEAQQTNVYLGHIGVRRSDPDFDALLVMDHCLGTGAGFTDRISKRVRDELGLAYTCYANITPSAGEEPGTFTAFLACKPENEARALEAMKGVIRTFVAEGPTEQELADAKEYLVRSRYFKFQTIAEMAAFWRGVEEYGLPADELTTFASRIERVTRADVLRVAKAHVDPDHAVLVRVGPKREETATGPLPAGLSIGSSGTDAEGRTWVLSGWDAGTRLAVRLAGNKGLAEVVVSEGMLTLYQPPGVELPRMPGITWVETRRRVGRHASIYKTRASGSDVLSWYLRALGFTKE